VNVRVDLRTGEFIVTNAGHPPVLHWNRIWSTWDLDSARGTALGLVNNPSMRQSKGMVDPGEALMLYTDGVVETRDNDVDVGIESLRETATKAVRTGFDDAARRVLATIKGDDDDRAVLILHRPRA
jgi:serine phosphatase RsbU (regulator of sigma subunit)